METGSNPTASPARQSGAWRYYPRQSKKCAPMAGFYELVGGFRAPVLATSGPEQPIVSGQYFKYSRFQETSAGDRVRSTSRGRRGSRVSLAGSFENRFHPSNRPPKSVASGAPERERLNTELRDALRRRYDRSRYWVRFCSRSSSSCTRWRLRRCFRFRQCQLRAAWNNA